MQATPLSATARAVIDRHVAASGLADGVRVSQWPGAQSVYYDATGRLWVHNTSSRRQAAQELYFYSRRSTVGTLTCSHPVKLWDLRRHLTVRETARLMGFPDEMVLSGLRQYNKLFGNAVAVPCAAHAISAVVGVNERIRHVDLCAGIGGFAFAARQACRRVRCVGYSEVLVCAEDSYRTNFPEAPALGDALQVRKWPACDLLTAGFPCQPFSNSNSRQRRADHSDLDFYRIVLRAVKASGATRIVLENVCQLQSVGRERYERLMVALARLGFETTTAVLDASDFGLPQERKRLFIAGRRDGGVLGRLGVPPAARKPTLASILERRRALPDSPRPAPRGRRRFSPRRSR
jgi:site-specific DNA-cytosine methylase